MNRQKANIKFCAPVCMENFLGHCRPVQGPKGLDVFLNSQTDIIMATAWRLQIDHSYCMGSSNLVEGTF